LDADLILTVKGSKAGKTFIALWGAAGSALQAIGKAAG
jgi:hypothetical protein